MRAALIETATGRVLNTLIVEEESNWTLPDGTYLQDAGNASPGDSWDGTRYVPSIPVSTGVSLDSLTQSIVDRIDAIFEVRGVRNLSAGEASDLRTSLKNLAERNSYA